MLKNIGIIFALFLLNLSYTTRTLAANNVHHPKAHPLARYRSTAKTMERLINTELAKKAETAILMARKLDQARSIAPTTPSYLTAFSDNCIESCSNHTIEYELQKQATAERNARYEQLYGLTYAALRTEKTAE